MNKTNSLSSSLYTFFKRFTILSIILIVVLLVFVGLYVYFFFELFSMTQGWLFNTIGLEGDLAKSFTALILAIITYFSASKLVIAFLPLPQKNKNRNRAILFLILAVIFFISYLVSPNVYFDKETGKPIKYYSIDPNGDYKFFSFEGFDPQTGDSLKPVTKEIIAKSKEKTKKYKNFATLDQASLQSSGDSIWLYKGSIANESESTVIFFLAKKNYNKTKKNFEIVHTIRPDEAVFINLEEGTHFFVVFNLDYEAVKYNYSADFNKIVLPGSILFNNKKYHYSDVYSFQVLPNRWSLTLKDRKISYKINKE